MVRIAFFRVSLVLFGLLAAGIALFPSSPALAEQTYAVKSVQVDVSDESAVKAREKAFAEAQKKAFLMLAQSFVEPDKVATLTTPSSEALAGMIKNFEVVSEQASAKRYVGVYSFRFRIAAVDGYFGHGPLYGATGTGPSSVSRTLIVPFYAEGEAPPTLERSKNLFLSTLQSQPTTDASLVIAKGDIADMNDVGESLPSNFSSKTLQRLKGRYDVDKVYTAVVRVDLKAAQTVKLEVYRADGGASSLVKSDSVTIDAVAAATYAAAKTVPAVDNPAGGTVPLSSDPNTPSLVVPPVETPLLQTEQPEQKTDAVPESSFPVKGLVPKNRGNRSSEEAAERDKRLSEAMSAARNKASGGAEFGADTPDLMASHSQERLSPPPQDANVNGAPSSEVNVGKVPVTVYFNTMDEWLLIQKQFSTLQGAKTVKILSLQTNKADVVIWFTNWQVMLSSLQSKGFQMTTGDGGATYVMKRMTGGF